MSDEQTTAIIEQAYENFKNGNVPDLLALFAADATWVYPDIAGVAFSGNRTGRELIGEFFASLNDAAESLKFDPQVFTATGAKVIAQGSYTFRTRDGDREYTCDFAHFFEVANGEIRAFQEYTDTAAVLQAYQKAAVV
ncbi:MAG: nuclear transport factor 2 family protein [Pyrinomonadaceae bacterium]